MFADSSLENYFKLIERETNNKNELVGYKHVGRDIAFMIATTSWIYIRQEVKNFIGRNIKYNIFYSKSIGTIIYIPAFVCIDFHRYDDINCSNTKYKILNNNAFNMDCYDKLDIIIDRSNEKLLDIFEKIQDEILYNEEQERIEAYNKKSDEEKHYIDMTNEFKSIQGEFSKKLKDLLDEYNIELFYDRCNEDNYIKYKGEDIRISISEIL
jgi:hypothetical protein